ncbi:MAG: hypothetical protein IGS03_08070 [Candidatus Sericytochromatia bacterium]|nr:hypothetical protein [Candidatus Sericytochromatia bacterium]
MTDRIGASSPQAPLTSIRPQPRPEAPPAPAPAEAPSDNPFGTLSEDPAVADFSLENFEGGPGRLNLSLPSNFNEGYNFAEPDVRFPDLNRAFSEAERPTMSRGEMVNNLREGLRDLVGDGPATVIEGAAALAYIADRQGFEVSRDMGPGRFSAEVSARNGGKVEIGFRMPLGGRNGQ